MGKSCASCAVEEPSLLLLLFSVFFFFVGFGLSFYFLAIRLDHVPYPVFFSPPFFIFSLTPWGRAGEGALRFT